MSDNALWFASLGLAASNLVLDVFMVRYYRAKVSRYRNAYHSMRSAALLLMRQP